MVGNAIGNFLEQQRSAEVLRESEKRFRDLANSIPAVLWIDDAEGHQTFCNRYALTLTGLPESRLAGEGWREVIHPDDLESAAAISVAALRAQAPFSTELRVRRADSEYRWMLTTAVPRFAGGNLRGHIEIGLDITELKLGYEQHLATQNLESLGVLAAGVAHDFNNLLGAIIVRSESALADLIPGSSPAEDAEQIRLTALRASEIVCAYESNRSLCARAGNARPHQGLHSQNCGSKNRISRRFTNHPRQRGGNPPVGHELDTQRF